MEGVDVGNELFDGVVDAASRTCAQEEEQQEGVEGKQRLPAPQVQGPAGRAKRCVLSFKV